MVDINEDAVRAVAAQLGPEIDTVSLYQSLRDHTACEDIHRLYLLKCTTSGIAPIQNTSSASQPERREPEPEPEPEPAPDIDIIPQRHPQMANQPSETTANVSQIELLPRVTRDRTHQRLTGSISTVGTNTSKRQGMLNTRGYRITGQVQKLSGVTNS